MLRSTDSSQGEFDMKRLQKWFEQIAGFSPDEVERQARAQKIFGTAGLDLSTLKKPACWRRKPRIQIFGA
jgi:hypothetical protein